MKKIAILTLALTMILPAQATLAAFPTRDQAIDQVINNLSAITSSEYTVEFSAVDNTYPAGEQAAYFGMFGAFENTNDSVISTLDVNYDIHQSGEDNQKGDVQAVLTKDLMYVNLDRNDIREWVSFPYQQEAEIYEDVYIRSSINIDSPEELREGAAMLLQSDAFEVTSFNPVQISNLAHSRTDFVVNTDAVMNLIADNYELTEEEAQEAKTYLNEHVTVYGHAVVNNLTMLPYQLSLTARIQDDELEMDVLTRATITFTSFNKDLNLDIPTVDRALENYWEIWIIDTDGDGLTDDVENTYYHTDPNNADTDGDGYSDRIEILNHYDPNGPWQMDQDQDGLGDRDELYIWYTRIYDRDTDHDGYDDATEVRNGYNPNGSGRLDTDHDGVSDYDELYVFHTNRYQADTDGDGYADGVEIYNGYNPNGPGRM